MKKGTENKAGRRSEMNVSLGSKTIDRYNRLKAEGDYSLIAAEVIPATTRQTVSKHLEAAAKAAGKGEAYKMPLSIAQAAQAFYTKKDKNEKALAA